MTFKDFFEKISGNYYNWRYWLVIAIVYFIIGFYYDLPVAVIVKNIVMRWFLEKPIYMGTDPWSGVAGFLLVVAFAVLLFIKRDEVIKIIKEDRKKPQQIDYVNTKNLKWLLWFVGLVVFIIIMTILFLIIVSS